MAKCWRDVPLEADHVEFVMFCFLDYMKIRMHRCDLVMPVRLTVLKCWCRSGLQANSQQPWSWHWCGACLPQATWLYCYPGPGATCVCCTALTRHPATPYCTPPSSSALPFGTAWSILPGRVPEVLSILAVLFLDTIICFSECPTTRFPLSPTWQHW